MNIIQRLKCWMHHRKMNKGGYWVDIWGRVEGVHDAYWTKSVDEAWQSFLDVAPELKSYFDNFEVVDKNKKFMKMVDKTNDKNIVEVAKKKRGGS